MALHEENIYGDLVGNILQLMVNNDIETVFKESNSSRTTWATSTKQKPKHPSTSKARPRRDPDTNVCDTNANVSRFATGAKMADDGPTPNIVQNESNGKQKGAKDVDKPAASRNKIASNGDNVGQLNSTVITTGTASSNITKP